MRVKVLVRARTVYGINEVAEADKVEYFNEIDWWDTYNGCLELYKYQDRLKREGQRKIASIKDWVWIKEDE